MHSKISRSPEVKPALISSHKSASVSTQTCHRRSDCSLLATIDVSVCRLSEEVAAATRPAHGPRQHAPAALAPISAMVA